MPPISRPPADNSGHPCTLITAIRGAPGLAVDLTGVLARCAPFGAKAKSVAIAQAIPCTPDSLLQRRVTARVDTGRSVRRARQGRTYTARLPAESRKPACGTR